MEGVDACQAGGEDDEPAHCGCRAESWEEEAGVRGDKLLDLGDE